MGFDCEPREVFEFIYHAKLDNGLSEHEYDHVVVGRFDGSPTPNRDEVDEWKWVNSMTIKLDMGEHPEDYTYWFRTSFDELCRSIKSVDVDSNVSIGDPSVECITMRSSWLAPVPRVVLRRCNCPTLTLIWRAGILLPR